MQAVQAAVGRAMLARPVGCARPALLARPPSVASASAEGMSWLNQQAADVEAQAAAQAAAAAADASDDSKAHSVGLGLHIRGRAVFQEGATDEDDPARVPFHKMLSTAAMAGHWWAAQAAVDDMAALGYVPGPRAYHALVFSHVKARDAAGALAAIRRCWDAGVTPLPETYAAVVVAHVLAGDVGTAEAVCASNRRAGVDCTKSWQQLVVALLRAGQNERAVEMLRQGEAEGMQPSEAIYEALMRLRCSQQDLDGATEVLQAMEERDMNTLSALELFIATHAAHGDPEVACAILEKLRLQPSPKVVALCDTVLEAQLRTCETLEEAASQVQRIKALLHGVLPGLSFYTIQLKAALHLHEAQAAMQAFRMFQNRGHGELQGLSDEVLGQLLLELSHAGLPSELYEVLSAMSRHARTIPACAMVVDDDGCTVLGAWVKQRQAQAVAVRQVAVRGDEEQESAVQQPADGAGNIAIDGVQVDPLLLSVVDAAGAPLTVSRMSVKELRAELVARRAAVSGNKKDLAKRVQKLRQLDGTRTATTSSLQRHREEKKNSGGGSKVARIVTELTYRCGMLEERQESEVEVEVVQDEDEVEAQEWDMMEDEEGGPSSRHATKDEDEDFFDDEDELVAFSSAQTQDTYILARSPPFTSQLAGPHEAAAILLGAVVDLHIQPSPADLQIVGSYILSNADVPAAVLLAAALDSLPGLAEGLQQLRHELASLCSSHDVDMDTAIGSILKDPDSSEGELVEADAVLDNLLMEMGI